MATTRKSQRSAKGKWRPTKANPAPKVIDLREKGRPAAKKPFYAYWYDAVNKCKGGHQTFATLPEATKWIQDEERDNLARYGRGEPSRAKTRALADVAWAWHSTLTLAHNTINGYRSSVHALVQHFGEETPVAAIDADGVRGFLHDSLKVHKLSRGTVKARLNVLNQIMEYAHERQVCTKNPCKAVVWPKDHQREAYIFTEAEIRAVLRELPGHLRLPVLLCYYSGLRIGEVCGLRKRELDLVRGTVKVVRVRHADGTEQEHAKGGKVGDYADLPDSVLPELRGYLAQYPPLEDGSLFSRKNSATATQKLTQDHLRYEFKKACKAARLPVEEIRFHDLRHTCATNYARHDAPAYVIQAQLRHGRLDTSQRYISKVQDEQRRSWANRVMPTAPGDTPEADPPAAAA